eukprot:Pgem_evm1s6966
MVKSRWPENSRLFLGNLSPEIQESTLKDIFGKYGNIPELNKRDHFGFVQFENPEIANLAVENEQNLTIRGRLI